MKCILVYGFLGSGKTSFIEQFMLEKATGKTVILENEVGNHSIDADKLRKHEYDVVDIRSGCVCCTLRGELRETFKNIRDNINPEYLIIEPSGIAALDDLISIPDFKADMIVSLLDVQKWPLMMKINEPFYKKQFGLSPIIILTKTDLVDTQVVEKVRKDVQGINPAACLFENRFDFMKMSLDEMFGHCSRFRNYIFSSGQLVRPHFETTSLQLRLVGGDALGKLETWIGENEKLILRYKDNLSEERGKYSGEIFICWADCSSRNKYEAYLQGLIR